MESSILKQIARFLQEQKKQKRWLVVFLCMAVIVGFGTVTALKMRGQAMTHKEKVVICQLDVHQHTDECYDEKKENLICGYADYVVHVHNDDCYDWNGNLTCQLPEVEKHEHSEECYTEEKTLICGLEESAGHQHGAECYTRQQGGLICQVPEHTHAAECYDETGAVICGLEEHVHEDACYEWSDVLTCQLAEGADGHTHTDACYEVKNVLTCGKLELHTHTDECYEKINEDEELSETNRRLICTIPVLEEHVHTEDAGCFEIVEVTANGELVEEENSEAESEDEIYTTNLDEEEAEGEDSAEEVGAEQKTYDETKTYKGDGYVVTVSYNKDANIPEEAELIAEQVTEENDAERYAEHKAQAREMIDDEETDKNALFKIGFYIEENGETKEVEPETPVAVTIQFLDEDGTLEGAPITIIHFAEEGNEVLDGSDIEDGSTTFEMESFSYVWVKIKPKNTSDAENEAYRLHLSDTFEYEDDVFKIKFHIKGEAEIPEKLESILTENKNDITEEGLKLQFTVERADKDSKKYQTFKNYEDRTNSKDELLRMCVLDYALTYEDIEIDLSKCEVTTEIDLTQEMKNRIDASAEEAVNYALENEGKVIQNGGESTAELSVGSLTDEAENAEGNGAVVEDDPNDEEGSANESPEEGEEEDSLESPDEDMEDSEESSGEDSEVAGSDNTSTTEGEEIHVDNVDEFRITVRTMAENAGVSDVVNEVERHVYDGVNPCKAVLTKKNSVNVTLSGKANPEFTVQYYANLNVLADSGTNRLDIINASKTGIGTLEESRKNNSLLPTNSMMAVTSNGKDAIAPDDPKLKFIYVDNNGNVQYTKQQIEVYKPREFKYSQAPSLMYFNALVENDKSYELKEIWVQQLGEENWPVKKIYNSDLHFTNREEIVNKNPDKYVLIKEGTIIRLIYDIKQSNFDASVNFYDYDISDGNIYKSALKSENNIKNRETDNYPWYIYTNQQGINSKDNYNGKGTGSRLAFGNNNTRTQLGSEQIESYNINMANTNVYRRCSFGLVTGLDKNGNIIYAPGVIAPNLFNEGEASGKTTYSDKKLEFIRTGDTYTLTAVSGTGAENLEQFSKRRNAYNSDLVMWSNEFWPMDNVPTAGTAEHDPKFGSSKTSYDSKVKDKGVITFDGSSSENTPSHDYGEDRNSYFGMMYTVKFDLGTDYIGPLEYYFFGDDDMWVFLDGKLVCDIGGVHQSVGEYVNLWDYLEEERESNLHHEHNDSCYDENAKLICSKEHTLSFYYTERGASGSTCWMQFTLPSVSSMTPQQQTGQFTNSLKVGKTVDNAVTNEQYSFRIRFTNEQGGELPDDYAYSKFKMIRETDKDGKPVFDENGKPVYKQKEENGEPVFDKDGKPVYETQLIGTDYLIHDGDTFTLGDGEYIIINYLPKGTKYTIEETSKSDQYDVTINGSATGSGSINADITQDTVVNYVNEYHVYELPKTGGYGPIIYTMAGVLVILTGAGFMYRKKVRERRV